MTYFLEEHAKKKFSILNHIILEANMNKPNNKTIANTIKLLLFDIFHSPKIKFLVLITLLMHIPMAAIKPANIISIITRIKLPTLTIRRLL